MSRRHIWVVFGCSMLLRMRLHLIHIPLRVGGMIRIRRGSALEVRQLLHPGREWSTTTGPIWIYGQCMLKVSLYELEATNRC